MLYLSFLYAFVIIFYTSFLSLSFIMNTLFFILVVAVGQRFLDTE